MKNDILKNHFLHPRNVGIVQNYDHKIIVKSDQCNDVITFTVTIAHTTIGDIKFEAYGCGYAIAGASMVSDAIKGKDIDEGIRDVEEMLNTMMIPDSNIRCVQLSLKAIKQLKDTILSNGHTA